MKISTSLAFFLVLMLFPLMAFAQALPIITKPGAPRTGCSVIDVHCKCINPDRDFVVKDQKLGRINPGEPPECKMRNEIDAQAERMPIAYCLGGDQAVKDVRKGESKCKATWTCKVPCELKP